MKIELLRATLSYFSGVHEGVIKPDVPLTALNMTDEMYEKVAYDLRHFNEDMSVEALKDLHTVEDLFNFITGDDNGKV